MGVVPRVGEARVPQDPRIELYAAIRRDSRLEGLSIRALARKYKVGRDTVRKALASAFPEPRKPMPPRKSKLDPFKGTIDDILRVDLDAPKKQRHTAKRIFDRLIEEWGMSDVSYPIVADYIAERRPQIAFEVKRQPPESFIRQTYQPGTEAEVDFGEAWILLQGERTKCFLFTLRLSYSGKAVHRLFVSCGQEAFFEGHVHAFSVLGGVPTGKIRYDNLKAAVQRVLGFNRSRTESDRWRLFRSHFNIDAFYCLPGKQGAHEKGGVEGEVGRFRRNHLVPMPEVASLDELNARIDAADEADDARRIGSRQHTVGEYFEVEQQYLAPLPTEPFETGRLSSPRVDRYSQVPVRGAKYSVPVRYIGRRVRVLMRASEVLIFHDRTEIACHPRLTARGAEHLELDHYLETLLFKPGALPGATALEQARASGKFTKVHEAWWTRVRRARGDAEGTRELIRVLMLHRTMEVAHVVAGLASALKAGALTADAVAVEARKAAQDATRAASQGPGPAEPGPRPPGAALPPDTRPLPSVAAYDRLLKHPRTPPSPPPGSDPP